MNFRRREDRAPSLVLASPAAPEGESFQPAGGYRLALLARSAEADGAMRPVREAEAALSADEAVLLLDLGARDAVLVAGAAVRPIPRGCGGEDLLERAAVGAAAWRQERLRAWRREQLPEKLIAFSEQLNAAETLEEVCRAAGEHVLRIVDGYLAVLFLREPGAAAFRPVEDCLSGSESRRVVLPRHTRFTRPGLLARDDARPDTGSPFSPLAPLFAETRAAVLAYTPVGEDGILFVVERRGERVFLPEDWDIFRALASLAEAALKRVRLLGEVRSLSLTDPLTGLANRRQMEVVLERAWAGARRGEPLTLVVLDLDDFKAVNDTHGHLAGDRILRTVADAMRQEVRGSDLVVRYGGDEFVVILPRGTEDGARALVERIRNRLAGTIGISVGVAGYEPSYASPEEMIAAADARLYAAKRRLARGGPPRARGEPEALRTQSP
ncbi:MAG TPA: GGDEF domain-containing protein [Longimicrobiaceae bacterium]|nr:GGDEF domain-containing protein [Longimicrobiaceae bacterium]